MPRIAEFNGISLCVYFGDHNPPHVHALYAEYEALVVIGDGSVYSGEMPGRQLKLIREYLARNRAEIMVKWKKAQGSAS